MATADPADVSELFEHFGDDDAADLIGEYPLVWVTSPSDGASSASLLPLLAERDDAGRIVRLIGHMARRNTLYPALTADPHALILVQGPQGYISPEWAGERRWVPTWTFAQLRMEADITFHPEGGDRALAALVSAMEAESAEPWTVEETGPRYRRMEQAIIAFTAEITVLKGRFKLSQDERPEVLRSILNHMADPSLARWTRRMNRERLEP